MATQLWLRVRTPPFQSPAALNRAPPLPPSNMGLESHSESPIPELPPGPLMCMLPSASLRGPHALLIVPPLSPLPLAQARLKNLLAGNYAPIVVRNVYFGNSGN